MTDAEQLELLRLRKKKALASQAAPAARPVQPAAGEVIPPDTTALLNAHDAMTFGWGGELRAARNTLGDVLSGQVQLSGVPDAYRWNRTLENDYTADANKQNPLSKWLGMGAGAVASAPLTLGKALQAEGLLAKMGAGASAAWKPGAAYGLGSSGADLSSLLEGQLPTRGEAVRAGADTTLGGLLSAGLGGTLPAVGAGIGWLGRNVGGPLIRLARGGFVNPTPEAERLAKEGAELTLGQMDPNSFFGRTEELATKAVTGGPLTAARQQGESSIRDAVLSTARAEGARPPTAGAPVRQQIQELKEGFTQLYDEALGGVKLDPAKYMGQGKWRGLLTDETLEGAAKTKGAFELAANDRGIRASQEVRDQALGWLTNKASILNPTKSGPNAGTVDARAVQTLRSTIGKEIAKLKRSTSDEAQATAEIFTSAKDFVTELLEAGLPPDRLSKLRRGDASYGDFLAVKDAAKKAFVDNEEFTAAQLLRTIGNKGATPELEAVARDAHAVLNPTYTPTGLQGAAPAVLPFWKIAGPAWANMANSSPGWREHAMHEAFAPGLPMRALKATGRALEDATMQARASVPASRTLYEMLRPIMSTQNDPFTSAVTP